jgi:hypothetical protein
MSDAKLDYHIFIVLIMYVAFSMSYYHVPFVSLYDSFSDRPLYSPLIKFYYKCSV